MLKLFVKDMGGTIRAKILKCFYNSISFIHHIFWHRPRSQIFFRFQFGTLYAFKITTVDPNFASLSFCNGGHFCCVLFHSARQNKENWLLRNLLNYKQLLTYLYEQQYFTLVRKMKNILKIDKRLILLGRLSSQVNIENFCNFAYRILLFIWFFVFSIFMDKTNMILFIAGSTL